MIINKWSIIKIGKSVIPAKLRTIAQGTQIQEVLELCSAGQQNGESKKQQNYINCQELGLELVRSKGVC